VSRGGSSSVKCEAFSSLVLWKLWPSWIKTKPCGRAGRLPILARHMLRLFRLELSCCISVKTVFCKATLVTGQTGLWRAVPT
jgi:hypothetical protein